MISWRASTPRSLEVDSCGIKLVIGVRENKENRSKIGSIIFSVLLEQSELEDQECAVDKRGWRLCPPPPSAVEADWDDSCAGRLVVGLS